MAKRKASISSSDDFEESTDELEESDDEVTHRRKVVRSAPTSDPTQMNLRQRDKPDYNESFMDTPIFDMYVDPDDVKSIHSSSDDFSDDDPMEPPVQLSVLHERAFLERPDPSHLGWAEIIRSSENIDAARNKFDQYVREKIKRPIYVLDDIEFVDDDKNRLFEQLENEHGQADLEVTALLYKLFHILNGPSLRLFFSDFINNLALQPRDRDDFMDVAIGDDDVEATTVILEPVLVKYSEIHANNPNLEEALVQIYRWLDELSRTKATINHTELDDETSTLKVIISGLNENLESYREDYNRERAHIEELEARLMSKVGSIDDDSVDTVQMLQEALNTAQERVKVLEDTFADITRRAIAIRQTSDELPDAPPAESSFKQRLSDVYAVLTQSGDIQRLRRERDAFATQVQASTHYVGLLESELYTQLEKLRGAFELEAGESTAVETLRKTVVDTIEKYTRLQRARAEELAPLHRRIEELEELLDRQNLDIVGLRETISRANVALQSERVANERLLREVSDLKLSIARLNEDSKRAITGSREYRDLRRELDQYRTQYDALRVEYGTLLQRYDGQEVVLTASNAENDSLRATIGNIEAARGRLLAQVGDLTQKIGEQEQKILQLQDQLHLRETFTLT